MHRKTKMGQQTQAYSSPYHTRPPSSFSDERMIVEWGIGNIALSGGKHSQNPASPSESPTSFKTYMETHGPAQLAYRAKDVPDLFFWKEDRLVLWVTSANFVKGREVGDGNAKRVEEDGAGHECTSRVYVDQKPHYDPNRGLGLFANISGRQSSSAVWGRARRMQSAPAQESWQDPGESKKLGGSIDPPPRAKGAHVRTHEEDEKEFPEDSGMVLLCDDKDV
ncbi:uncharacterized protein F5147DRAFT_764531, partial [Suillus discolor]